MPRPKTVRNITVRTFPKNAGHPCDSWWIGVPQIGFMKRAEAEFQRMRYSSFSLSGNGFVTGLEMASTMKDVG